MKLKGTIQDIYAHARNLHVAQYGCKKQKKKIDAEAIIITLLILNFSHFDTYFFLRKITFIRIHIKNNLSPIWFCFQI